MSSQSLHREDRFTGFRIYRQPSGDITIRRPLTVVGIAFEVFFVFLVFIAAKNLIEAVAGAQGTGSWLLLAAGAPIGMALLWSAWRKGITRMVITSSEIVVRNVWRTYRLRRADVQALALGSTIWRNRVGVIKTDSGERVPAWALDLGYSEGRSDDELRSLLSPVAEALGLDRVQ